jgi:hypothetical protein
MWEPRRLTTLWAFTACYRDSFTFFALSSNISLSLPSRVSPSSFYDFSVSYTYHLPMRTTYLIHLAFLDFMNYVNYGAPQHVIFSILLSDLNIPLSTRYNSADARDLHNFLKSSQGWEDPVREFQINIILNLPNHHAINAFKWRGKFGLTL